MEEVSLYVLERLERIIFDPEAEDLRNEIRNLLDSKGIKPLTRLDEIPNLSIYEAFLRFERDSLNMPQNLPVRGDTSDLNDAMQISLIVIVSRKMKYPHEVFDGDSVKESFKTVLKSKYANFLKEGLNGRV